MNFVLISSLYMSLCAFLLVWLSLQVINRRHEYKVNIGDGNNQSLRLAIAAQQNAVEYMPIALLMLVALEINAAEPVLVHLLGIALVTGRVLHARAMLTENLGLRIRGMQITIFTILGLGIANIIYLVYRLVAN